MRSPRRALARRLQRLRNVDSELGVAFAWLLLAALGWALGSTPLAIVGVLGLVTTGALYVWQRECLTGVSYRRELGRTHATFDERVTLQVEIVNDKLLPLSWLWIGEDVPTALTIEGGAGVVPGQHEVGTLVHLQPMLPYERVRRRLTVICDHRGEHRFGPARMSSGDPLSLRTRTTELPDVQRLLVYPKVFALAPPGIASRVVIGQVRARQQFLQDPSRIAGVREYRHGDPLRHVDWRATARAATLLVREFEPTSTLQAAVFLDFHVAGRAAWRRDPPEREFTISVAASLISELAQRKVPTGLYSSGTIAGHEIVQPASSSPAALTAMMTALGRAMPGGYVGFPRVLSRQSGRLARGTSVVVVANDFPVETLLAIAELRRRHAVTAIWIETGHGSPPPDGQVDARLQASYCDDWQRRELLELAA